MGCAGQETVATPQTPQQAVFAAKGAYAAALNVAVAYVGLPRCSPASPPLCSKQEVVDQVKKAGEVAGASLDAAEATVRSPGVGVNPQTAVTAAQQAILALTSITQTLQVK